MPVNKKKKSKNYDNQIVIYKEKISESLKTIPAPLPPKNLMIILKTDNYQGSRWEMMYRQDECQATLYQEKEIDKKRENQVINNQGKYS